MRGILNIDKPGGMTSARVVAAVKKLVPTKVGHGGTLDPLATGVLPILVGQATRVAQYMLGGDKAYEAEITLGLTTDTDDIDGNVVAEKDWANVTDGDIEQALKPLSGEIDQVPPAVSAVKVQGQRAYKLARGGFSPTLKERRVTIHELELVRREGAKLIIRVACSKGTYIRSIARDLGQSLGCGGCISQLRRTQSGALTLDSAIQLPERLEDVAANLISIEEALSDLDSVPVEPQLARRVLCGQKVLWTRPPPQSNDFLIIDQGRAIAVAYLKDGLLRYRCVLPPPS